MPSKSAEFASKVTREAAFAALEAALAAGRDPYSEPVLTQGGAETTLGDCSFAEKRLTLTNMIGEARERKRVADALAAGQDPFAEHYTVAAHEGLRCDFLRAAARRGPGRVGLHGLAALPPRTRRAQDQAQRVQFRRL